MSVWILNYLYLIAMETCLIWEFLTIPVSYNGEANGYQSTLTLLIKYLIVNWLIQMIAGSLKFFISLREHRSENCVLA